jgi:hypothetical protein
MKSKNSTREPVRQPENKLQAVADYAATLTAGMSEIQKKLFWEEVNKGIAVIETA